MCTRFLHYLEKKLSCFRQETDGDDCSEERSTRDEDCRNSSEADQGSDQENSSSFQSYSDEDSPGEDVVESTGRRETRTSSYEDCYSKTMGSTSTVGNDKGLQHSEDSSKTNSPEQRKQKPVTISQRAIKQKKDPSQVASNERKRTHHKEHNAQEASRNSDTKFSSKEKKRSKIWNSAKQLAVSKKKEGKKSDVELKETGERKILTRKIEREKMLPKNDFKRTHSFKQNMKSKDKLEREKKIKKPVEKKNASEVMQGGKNLATNGNVSKISKGNERTTKVEQHKNSTKSEEAVQKKPAGKDSNRKPVTFSKRTKTIPSRNVPTFRAKSIAKRSSVKSMRNEGLSRRAGILKKI